MGLTDKQTDLLAKRRKVIRAWSVVGPLLLLAVVCLGLWLFFRHPLLANPPEVAARLNAGVIPDSTLFLMAVLLPCAVLMSLGLVAVTIIVGHLALSNEKKLVAIADTLLEDAGDNSEGYPNITA